MDTCPAVTEELTIEQILTRTAAMSQGEWIAKTGSIESIGDSDHYAVGVIGSDKAVAVFGAVGESDELDAESIANMELVVHAPRLRRELIALREQESEDLAHAYEILSAIRKGMLALFNRYKALHICASRYLKEWADEAPKGWSRDELEGCLEMPLPELAPDLDPDLACQQREEIEEWVVGCKGSLYAVVLLRLLTQSDELMQLRESLHEANRRINAGFELICREGCDCGDTTVKLGEHTCFAGKMEHVLKGGTA